MATLGGTDLGGILKAIQQGVGDLIGGFRPDTTNPATAALGQVGKGLDLWDGLQYGSNPTAYTPPASAPMQGYRPPAPQGFGGVGGFGGGLWDGLSFGTGSTAFGVGAGPDLFGGFQQAKQAADQAHQQQQARDQAAAQFGGGAGGFTGPATSDDNKALTPEAVDAFIRSKFPNSPLAGQGAYILQRANAMGVSVPLLLGIGWKESGMGTNTGAGNIFGITDPTRDQGLGGQRVFQGYGNVQAEIDGAIANLASAIYKGKSAQEQIGAWYVGPEEYMRLGLAATDRAGNGTVGDYLNNFIAPVYQGLGVAYNQAQAPTRAAGNAPVTADGFSFPVQGYSGNVALHWGSEHGGADLFAPVGTPVVSLGAGTVVDAGSNSLGGNTVTIRLDNGLLVYMAHMRDAPLVRAGQRVNAGQQLGFVGDTGNAQGTGAHLHIGIGYDIISGGGATGGLGSGFDANAWLNAILNQTRGGATGTQRH